MRADALTGPHAGSDSTELVLRREGKERVNLMRGCHSRCVGGGSSRVSTS